jgi:A/G-specific adenine glycosylase
MKASQKEIKIFKEIVWNYYHLSGRNDLPWRKKINPYRVWVSEVMLQQTQVDRVRGFFDRWVNHFPTIKDLSIASQIDILRLWKGLGYNSRALRMKKCAQEIMQHHQGKFPKSQDELQKLSGIGPYTAGAISAFAYNQPAIIIETNIRRVFIHHFFDTLPSLLGGGAEVRGGGCEIGQHTVPHPNPPLHRGGDKIHDSEILELIEQTLDSNNSREWYWALMDYGSFLGRTLNIKGKKYNPNVQSKHYTKQSKFEGSDREIRSNILRLLLENNNKIELSNLKKEIKKFLVDNERIQKIINQMDKEGYLEIKGKNIKLKK